MSIEEYEKIVPVATIDHDGKKIHYNVPNRGTLWRVNTLFDKEPDTMEWLATFGHNDVLLDVGANVGMYSIWAAATRGTRVFAFEPESQNYATLCKNIYTNQLHNLITAYPLALSDETLLDVLNMSHFMLGSSCHTFKDATDFNLREITPAFTQGCFATTLDSLVQQQGIPLPNHIKIDVDGIEHKVIGGMKETLQNKTVRSVLIEINTHLEEHQHIIAMMHQIGFTHDEAKTNRYIRDEGTFKGVGNFIFFREAT